MDLSLAVLPCRFVPHSPATLLPWPPPSLLLLAQAEHAPTGSLSPPDLVKYTGLPWSTPWSAISSLASFLLDEGFLPLLCFVVATTSTTLVSIRHGVRTATTSAGSRSAELSLQCLNRRKQLLNSNQHVSPQC